MLAAHAATAGSHPITTCRPHRVIATRQENVQKPDHARLTLHTIRL